MPAEINGIELNKVYRMTPKLWPATVKALEGKVDAFVTTWHANRHSDGLADPFRLLKRPSGIFYLDCFGNDFVGAMRAAYGAALGIEVPSSMATYVSEDRTSHVILSGQVAGGSRFPAVSAPASDAISAWMAQWITDNLEPFEVVVDPFVSLDTEGHPIIKFACEDTGRLYLGFRWE